MKKKIHIFYLLLIIAIISISTVIIVNMKKTMDDTVAYCTRVEPQLMYGFDIDYRYYDISCDDDLTKFESDQSILELKDEWDNIGNELYDLLLESDIDEKVKSDITEYHNNWLNSYSQKVKFYSRSLDSRTALAGGTIGTSIISRYEYKMSRSHTLFLLTLCVEHRIVDMDFEGKNVSFYTGEDENKVILIEGKSFEELSGFYLTLY